MMIKKPLVSIQPRSAIDAYDSYLANQVLVGTTGNDRIGGSYYADQIDASQGGDDIVHAGGGRDIIRFGAAFTTADQINGGSDFDTVTLDGDYSAGFTARSDNFHKIEELILLGGDYNISGLIDFEAYKRLTIVDGSGLVAGQSLNINVTAAGNLEVFGGAGNDTIHASLNGHASELYGMTGNDTLIGGAGERIVLVGGADADAIICGTSPDIIEYDSETDSTSKRIDIIEGFDSTKDRLYFFFDSDKTTTGYQYDFHLGKTPERVGDVLFHYEVGSDQTVVQVFTDADRRADLVIHITGDVDLTAANFIFFGS